jgi:hypothetical protein
MSFRNDLRCNGSAATEALSSVVRPPCLAGRKDGAFLDNDAGIWNLPRKRFSGFVLHDLSLESSLPEIVSRHRDGVSNAAILYRRRTSQGKNSGKRNGSTGTSRDARRVREQEGEGLLVKGKWK